MKQEFKIDQIRATGTRLPGMQAGISPEGDPEFNLLIRLAKEFQDWRAWHNPSEPDHFQVHGPNLRLIPSGFPLKDPDGFEKIINYLNS